MDVEVNLDYSV